MDAIAHYLKNSPKNLIKKKKSLLKLSSWNDLHMKESSKDHFILIVHHAVYQITSDLCCKQPFLRSIWLAKAYSIQEAMQLCKSSHFMDTVLHSISGKRVKILNVFFMISLSNLGCFSFAWQWHLKLYRATCLSVQSWNLPAVRSTMHYSTM